MDVPRTLALAVCFLTVLSACASIEERWAEAHFVGISYPTLYNQVLTTVDSEGFVVRHRFPEAGRLESDWIYGTSQRRVRGPSRRKVFAVIEPDERPDGFVVRLRVAEEVVRKGGLLATNVRASEDWEPFDDNFDDAELLMAKLVALVNAAAEERGPPDEEGGRL
jgi:hypothetical protein